MTESLRRLRFLFPGVPGVVGVVLTTFGVFFTAEGLGVSWPGDDAALLYVAALIVLVSQLRIATLARWHDEVATA